jgi:hypothetical protein
MRFQGIDGRRSPRAALQVGVEIAGAGEPVRGQTVEVNRQGALVLAPRSFQQDELVRLLHLESRERVLCRIVWCRGEIQPGIFWIGLEIVSGSPEFWGEHYEVAARGKAMERALPAPRRRAS